MDLEKGFARFESFPRRERTPQASLPRLKASFKSHASDDCVCRSCRKLRLLERLSMEPLGTGDKVYLAAVVLVWLAVIGYGVATVLW